MMRKSLLGAFILVAIGAASMLGVACQKSKPLQIGFVAGLSGRVADLGVGGRNGAMLAVEQRNAVGGVNGRTVELVMRDDEQNPEIARRAVQELISMKVEAIIGPMTSSIGVAVAPLANEAKMLMLSPTVTTTDLSGKDDYFLRVISSTTEYAGKNAKYQFDVNGVRTAAVIYDLDNKSYTESWLRDFRAEFEKRGGRITNLRTFVSSKNVAFLPLVRELLRERPGLLLVIANSVDAAQICQQVRKLDAKTPISIAEWGSTERFVELGGITVEGVQAAQFLNRSDQSARYQDFRSAFRERFGQEPGFAGMAGYDAAQVVLEALSRREPGQTLKEAALTKGPFQGVQQQLVFDRFGDAVRKTYITVIRNGQFTTVE